MNKRIISFALVCVILLGLILGISGVTLPVSAAEGGVTIRLHYHRPDGNYEGWNVWFWAEGLDGDRYDFEEVNGEMVATVTVKTGTMSVGYIVRNSIGTDWAAKDVDGDQFLDLTGILSGTVDIYVESGVPNTEYVEGPDVVKGVMVVAAKYDKNKGNIRVRMSMALDYEPNVNTFTVRNADGVVPVTEIKAMENYYYLTVGELKLDRAYTITFEGLAYDVTMPDFYGNEEFEGANTYTGNDLGATYTKEQTTLRVWAPTAVGVKVNLYTNGDPDAQPEPTEQVPMTKDVNGTWVVTLEGDRNGVYYTYEVTLDNAVNEACDPYARTTGVNGHRAMIIDLDSTDPEGWGNDSDPHAGKNFTDAIIYELHVRDLSSDPSSGITNVGKYLGLTETGTTNSNGIPTGIDHIKNLGVTHVHLLPVYDFGSVDETGNGFNWGYDPVNYNVPEGSYSTDPYNGAVRVREFKQMVSSMHRNGLSVIMDVVYNHVQSSSRFCFNQIVPGYFSRPNSNGSGCGNDTASERAMVKKYIVDSVVYWADEYHIDGFRFDLVGLIDTETINAIMEEVHKTHPNVVFYGEGWSMNTVLTKDGYTMATQTNSTKVPGFAFFSDTIRNLIKGNTYGGVSAGFISGGAAAWGDLNACFKGMPNWCKTPSQSINYISCHDNNILFDHITMVKPDASLADRIQMNKLGATFYMMAQGIPFFQAGEEILRSKPKAEGGFDENSYASGDAVNSIKWDTLNDPAYMDMYNFYKGLIAFRKAHPALRLTNAADVNANVVSVSGMPANMAAYQIAGGMEGETAKSIFVVFNANQGAKTVQLPAGNWNIYVDGKKAGTEVIKTVNGSISVPAVSGMVLVQEDGVVGPMDVEPTETNWGLIIGLAVGIVVLGAAVGAVLAVLPGKKKEEQA